MKRVWVGMTAFAMAMLVGCKDDSHLASSDGMRGYLEACDSSSTCDDGLSCDYGYCTRSCDTPCGTDSECVTEVDRCLPTEAADTLRNSLHDGGVAPDADVVESDADVVEADGGVEIDADVESDAHVPHEDAGVIKFTQETYLKASTAMEGDEFGRAIAISSDGKTLVVGAPRVSPHFSDNQGAVFIFTYGDSHWTEQSFILSPVDATEDEFGCAVSLSADGNTLVIGAHGEGANDVGAGYIYTRTGSTWSQQAHLTVSGLDPNTGLGATVALSGNGNYAALGGDSDRVFVFAKSGSSWTQQADLSGSHGGFTSYIGDLSFTSDGATLAVGAPMAQATMGAAFIFSRSGSSWSEQAFLTGSHAHDTGDWFGQSLAISADGSTLIVGATGEDSGSLGGLPTGEDSSVAESGAAYVFEIVSGSWSQRDYFKAYEALPNAKFGWSVAISADGKYAAVGSNYYDDWEGAVYGFQRLSGRWYDGYTYQNEVPMPVNQLGFAMSLSGDGNSLAVGAPYERSLTRGVDGDQENFAGSEGDVGAAFVFKRGHY